LSKKIFVTLSIILMLAGAHFGFDAYKKYQAKTAIETLLNEAKLKADQAVIKRAQEFRAFIDAKKVGAKPFSQDVIGLKGTWMLIKCTFPGTGDECRKEYIAEKFSEHIFTPDDFRDAMNRAIQGGVQDIDGIENQLAVSLRQVILGRSLTPNEMPSAEAEFKSTIEAARSASNDAVLKETGGLVVTEVVTQITMQVLIRMGAPLLILTTAAANSWWTLGGSLVIGLAVNAIWNIFNDPAEDVEAAMLVELDKMSSSGSAAIQDELTKKVAARSQFWETTVKEALQ
jgi:hypothetical protein